MNKKWKKSLNRRENKKPETDQRPEPDPEPELPSSSESKLTSSIFYKFQVGIVYATGVLDIISSCVLLSCCREVLQIINFTEDLQTSFPNISAAHYRQIIKVVMEAFGKTLEDMDPDILNNLGDLQPHSLLYAKIIFALLLSVSLYFLLLSGILFSAIHKKHYMHCHVWNVCLSVTLAVYIILALVVLTFGLFELSADEITLIFVYGFYRSITVFTVYGFQQKYLIIAQQEPAMDPHRELHYLD